MKRVEDARLIKLAETPVSTSAGTPGAGLPTASLSAVATLAANQPQVIPSPSGGAATIVTTTTMQPGNNSTSIFPTRNILTTTDMPQQPLPAAQQQPAPPQVTAAPGQPAASYTRVLGPAAAAVAAGAGAVSVFRNDGAVAITAVAPPSNPAGAASGAGGGAAAASVVPPAAHSGTVVTTLPLSLHQPQATNNPVVTQPPINIKPPDVGKYFSLFETKKALPTTPVQYPAQSPSGTFQLQQQQPLSTGSSAAVKTIGPATMAANNPAQNLVQTLQQQQQQQNQVAAAAQQQAMAQQQQQQQKHPQSAVQYGPPGIRTISSMNVGAVNATSEAMTASGGAIITAQRPMVPVPAPAATTATVGGGGGTNSSRSASGENSGKNSGNAQFQRLKVEDALSYLDQVKYKFGNQPQVYNNFLDIMKEFKSQSIDTPGVIARVSSLFKGHPELIVGFNTFLPPGYKIEVQCNQSEAMNNPGVLGAGMQTIVHTPHGIHTVPSNLTSAGSAAPSAANSVTVTPPAAIAAGVTAGGAQVTATTVATSQPQQPQQQQHTTIRPVSIQATTQPPQPPPQQQQQQQQQTSSTTIRHVGGSNNSIKTEPATAASTNNLLPQQPAHYIQPVLMPQQQPAAPQHQHASSHLQQNHALHSQPQPQTQPQPQQPQSNCLNSNRAALSQDPASQAPSQQLHPQQSSQSQPVEFNHAINYVNKIKNRFIGQPDVYKQFLEILHTYQKDQKLIKEGHPPSSRSLTEAEVFAQVSSLFKNQEDLLSEFSQFLPEATGDGASMMMGKAAPAKKPTMRTYASSVTTGIVPLTAPKYSSSVTPLGGAGIGAAPGGGPGGAGKRPPLAGLPPSPPKKAKLGGGVRDVSLAEAGKHGTLNEFAFFDKVRKSLQHEESYNNFLRCLILFNQEIVSRAELVQIVSPFLNRHPELNKWFRDFVGYVDPAAGMGVAGGDGHMDAARGPGHAGAGGVGIGGLGGGREITGGLEGALAPPSQPGRERMSGDSAMDVDYATCKRLGASYCALPKDFQQPKCQGRTALCKEVLNDTWVSFPSWSEDSQFVTSRKTQFEEFIYRAEDERFEFDVILETNKDTIKVLECVQKKMNRMAPEEAARYRLDDNLGGCSPTIHQRAIRRIYGDKSADIIDGLKRNPVVAIPLVLRRLKAKDEEWREVQKNFNKIWREQNEKFYLKSLDHQGIMFKQTDSRQLRSKYLLNEVETLFEERQEQDSGLANQHQDVGVSANQLQDAGPHMTIEYADTAILDSANNLLLHHVKRQAGIHKEDKHKIKLLLRHFILDLFKHPRQEMSDDEREDDEDEDKDDSKDDDDEDVKENSNSAGGATTNGGSKSTRSERARKKRDDTAAAKKDGKSSSSVEVKVEKEDEAKTEVKTEPNCGGLGAPGKDGRRTPLHARDMESGESYSMMMCSNHWYLFLRLHNILCDRLTKMYSQALVIAGQDAKDKRDKRESTASALRMKPRNEIDPQDYFPAFLDMVKGLLDGNMESQAYEDMLREMFGIHAFNSFTLDKVVGNAVRQLQHMVTDEASADCHHLFESESRAGATGGLCQTAHARLMSELMYQKKAEKLLADENCFKVYVYHQRKRVTIELLDSESMSQTSDHEQEEENARNHNSYVENFLKPDHPLSEDVKSHQALKPSFLQRCIRQQRKRSRVRMRVPSVWKTEEEEEDSEEGVSKSKYRKSNPDDSASASAKSTLNHSLRFDTDGDGYIVEDDTTEIKFDQKTSKAQYVLNKGNLMYKVGSFKRAKKLHKLVCRRKSGSFHRWLNSWVQRHVSEKQRDDIANWFMGTTDGLVANKTHKIVRNDNDRTPYRTYYKYKAEMLGDDGGNASQGAAAAASAATSAHST